MVEWLFVMKLYDGEVFFDLVCGNDMLIGVIVFIGVSLEEEVMEEC